VRHLFFCERVIVDQWSRSAGVDAAAAVVLDDDGHHVFLGQRRDPGVIGSRVFEHVGQGFLVSLASRGGRGRSGS